MHCIFGGYMQAEIRRQSLLSIFLAFVVGLGLVPQAAATKKVCGQGISMHTAITIFLVSYSVCVSLMLLRKDKGNKKQYQFLCLKLRLSQRAGRSFYTLDSCWWQLRYRSGQHWGCGHFQEYSEQQLASPLIGVNAQEQNLVRFRHFTVVYALQHAQAVFLVQSCGS